MLCNHMTHNPDNTTEYGIFLSGPLQECMWQLFWFLQEAGNCLVICYAGECRTELESQCKNTILLYIDNLHMMLKALYNVLCGLGAGRVIQNRDDCNTIV